MWSVELRKKIYFVPLVLVEYYYGWMDEWCTIKRVKRPTWKVRVRI